MSPANRLTVFHRLEDRLRLGAQLRVIRQHRGLAGNAREELRAPGRSTQRRRFRPAPAPRRAHCSRRAWGSRPAAHAAAPRRAGAPCRDRLRSRPRPAGSSDGRRHRPAARPASTPRSAGLRSRHCGISSRHPVEHQPPEAGVVLGQIVDLRLLARARADNRAAAGSRNRVGQSTLNEKSTARSSGSKLAGGACGRAASAPAAACRWRNRRLRRRSTFSTVGVVARRRRH